MDGHSAIRGARGFLAGFLDRVLGRLFIAFLLLSFSSCSSSTWPTGPLRRGGRAWNAASARGCPCVPCLRACRVLRRPGFSRLVASSVALRLVYYKPVGRQAKVFARLTPHQAVGIIGLCQLLGMTQF